RLILLGQALWPQLIRCQRSFQSMKRHSCAAQRRTNPALFYSLGAIAFLLIEVLQPGVPCPQAAEKSNYKSTLEPLDAVLLAVSLHLCNFCLAGSRVSRTSNLEISDLRSVIGHQTVILVDFLLRVLRNGSFIGEILFQDRNYFKSLCNGHGSIVSECNVLTINGYLRRRSAGQRSDARRQCRWRQRGVRFLLYDDSGLPSGQGLRQRLILSGQRRVVRLNLLYYLLEKSGVRCSRLIGHSSLGLSNSGSSSSSGRRTVIILLETPSAQANEKNEHKKPFVGLQVRGNNTRGRCDRCSGSGAHG